MTWQRRNGMAKSTRPAFADDIPALKEAADAIVEIRWPATSPRKALNRELLEAQAAARATEKAVTDAPTRVEKAKAALATAEEEEEKAADKWKEARLKEDSVLAQLAALSSADDKSAAASDDFKEADDGMDVLPGAVQMETFMAGMGQKIAGMKAHQQKLREKSAKGVGKGEGKGGKESVRPDGPYAAADDPGLAAAQAEADNKAAAAVAAAVERGQALEANLKAAVEQLNRLTAEWRCLDTDFAGL